MADRPASTPDREPAEPDPVDERVLAFARSELGPASERLLQQPEARAAVAARLHAGRSIPDAVLGHIHANLTGRRQLSDEFAAYFLFDLMKMGKLSMASSSKLRRFLDTGDLVLSVFGDLWGDVSAMQFESTNQFKSLFSQRMNWKAADQARRLTSLRRREDQRVPGQPEDMDLEEAHDSDSAPLPHAIRAEERERLILILLRLKERDRRLLTLHLKGRPLDEIARELQLSSDAARKALSRAIEQARRYADDSQRAHDGQY